MRRTRLPSRLLIALALGWLAAAPVGRAAEDKSPAAPRVVRLFDNDWRFLKGEVEGAEAVSFDDSSWRKLDVPHDWSIEGPFDQNAPTGGAGGYLPAGIGWYRKHFSLPADYKAKRVFIEF